MSWCRPAHLKTALDQLGQPNLDLPGLVRGLITRSKTVLNGGPPGDWSEQMAALTTALRTILSTFLQV